MALTLTINGADVLDYLEPGAGNPGLDRALQTRSVMRFVLKDRAAVYRPVLRQDVIAAIDGVRIFGGVITTIEEGDWGDYKGHWFNCEAADYAAQLEVIEFNGIAIGATLKDVVQHLVTARLAPLGFTVHPSMAAGPVINSQGYSFRYLTDIFNDLSRITQWPWIVDEYRRILFAPADGIAAPFALTATNDTINTIRVTHTTDGYANRVWLHYGAAGFREVTEAWTASAGQTDFVVVNFPNPEGINAPPVSVSVAGVAEAVGVAGEPWTWTAGSGTLTRVAGGLAAGTAVSTVYGATFPAAIYDANNADIALYGEFDLIEKAPDVFDVNQARQIAAGMLAERAGPLRRLAITTHSAGLVPGHSVPVDVPERAINEPCLLLSSRLVYDGRLADGSDYWRFELELVEGSAYRETWQKFFRDIARQETGAAVSASGLVGPAPIGGGGGASAAPLPSAVFYRYLGGSRTVAAMVPAAAPDAWIPIAGFIDAFVDFDAMAGRLAQVSVQCRTHDPAVTVTPRVVTVDGAGNRGVVLATGEPTNATAWTYQGIVLPSRTGLTPVRVELTASVRNRDVFVANAMLDVFGAVVRTEAPPPAEAA